MHRFFSSIAEKCKKELIQAEKSRSANAELQARKNQLLQDVGCVEAVLSAVSQQAKG